jgi:anti-sigma B factor antagonist
MPEPGSRLDVIAVDGGWSIEGEIDAHTAPRLAAALAEIPDTDIVVAHFGGVTFLDSSGLRVLVEATTRAVHEGRELIISNPSAAVRRVVAISGLSDTLHLRD